MVLILKIYFKLILLFSIIFVLSLCQSTSKENKNVWANMFNKYVWNNKTKQATQSLVNFMKPGLLTRTVERFKVIVNTTYGRIAGERKLYSLKGDEYFYQFRGIPYAAAPVGNLRFKPPQPMKPWSDIKDAFEFGASCVQCNTRGPFGSEDCLFINVYTSEMPKNGTNLKPVMFWIYGGSFQTGSADIYGPEYLIRKDIVLVTFNYRVNVLGFFALGNKEVSGNYGLKDQLFALKWVQANIANFGGDPSRVTIFGESAGSASVQYQLLSAQSKGLFHQAIVQSGSALDPWALTKSPKDVAFKLAKSLGHNLNNTNELYLFFMQQPADLLARASDKLLLSEEQKKVARDYLGNKIW
uniref:Carboxylic ester hydrolase n=1 Tax=Clastoptera arizonana TaxID=38151 RepID=A0A1B6CKI6_9HEMI